MLNFFKNKFKAWNNKSVTDSQEADLPYNSLSPISTVQSPHYSRALEWALNNREVKDIKNIALTGPYGSGKSSILKTFKQIHDGKDFHFLNISLATFKEENPENTKPIIGEDLLRLIELSILQQIFYFEEDNKIPYSRFKKIKNYNRKKLFLEALALLVLLLSFLNLAYPDLLKILTNIKSFKTFGIIYYTSFAITIGGILIILYKSISSIKNLRINKLNFSNTEIELGKDLDKSILNHHLDEIIYFFEVRPYNVVIIEDLDRFEQTEIFTKLREINLLINSSKKVKKQVIFIYAVRDDIFIDKERTKFFDFIIPVIPVINSSNSKEILLTKKNDSSYNLSTDLLENISLFIDDMRLLHNIMNEFYLYYQHLHKSLSQDKLLSILIYKNIFPNDFTDLSENTGIFYEAINSRKKYLEIEIQEKDKEIKALKEQIHELEGIKLKDSKELKRLYILQYISRLPNFKSFLISGRERKINDLLEDELFDYLTNDNFSYYRFNNYNSGAHNIVNDNASFKFHEIEKDIDPYQSYSERKKQIDERNTNKIEALKNNLQNVEKEKNKIKKLKVKDFAAKGVLTFSSLNKKQKSLINILLRNGYISEDYFDYISIFYEGSISKTDNDFLINVKTQINSDLNYKLNKVDKLIDKISLVDFDYTYSLNFDLLDFILKTQKHKTIQDSIINQLANESETSIKFIDEFIKITPNIKEFINSLCNAWPNIWNFILNKSNYPEEKIREYFKLIVEYCSLKDLKHLEANQLFINYFSSIKEIRTLTQKNEKVKNILKEFNLKLIDISTTDPDNELKEFIYEHNLYEINIKNLVFLLKETETFNQVNFDTMNYNAIHTSKLNHLIGYIEENIDLYIKEIFLKLEANVSEDQNSLVNLLNHSLLDPKLKVETIDK